MRVWMSAIMAWESCAGQGGEVKEVLGVSCMIGTRLGLLGTYRHDDEADERWESEGKAEDLRLTQEEMMLR